MKASKKELFYDSIADVWTDKINNSETEKRLSIVFGELFKGIKLKDKKFLEVGCGLGYFSEMANKKGAKVTGVDVGKNLVNICKKKVPRGKFLVASALDLPLEDNTYDVVLCTEVIEHVEIPYNAIDEIYRVTKIGGHIVITTPNKVFKPLFDLLSFLKLRPYQGNENWLFPWELKSHLVKKNFNINKEYYFNFITPNKYFDLMEKFWFSKYITINQGYLLQK